FDDGVDLNTIVRRIAHFFREESCGQCVPCRVGTVRQEEALQRLTDGTASQDGRAAELSLLDDIGRVMRDASICGLGQAASNPLTSVIKYFPDEFKDAAE
ncbi:MAG: hypothetical protein JO084_01080, partial [Bradyrhizobiaceae bacterium]|nr:hypothetical protein [Bradyrhizobiaceae bacterium]